MLKLALEPIMQSLVYVGTGHVCIPDFTITFSGKETVTSVNSSSDIFTVASATAWFTTYGKSLFRY
jgi:hypothetical protein